MAEDRIRLGAADGGDDPEKQHHIMFTPYLAQCEFGNAGLIVHSSKEAFESPVPGRGEDVPQDDRTASVRFTASPCNVYAPEVNPMEKEWTGPEPVRMLLLRWNDNTVETAELGENDAYSFEFDDSHFDGDGKLVLDSLPDDVFMYLRNLGAFRSSIGPGRVITIPNRWTETHAPREGALPDRYAASFCIYTVRRVDADYPADKPTTDGYEFDDYEMIGLADSQEDDNGVWGNIELWYDMCPVDSAGLVISNKATSVGTRYPLPADNPFVQMAGIVNTVEYAANARAYFLLYLTKWRSTDGYTRTRLSCVCVEYLSWPTGASSKMTDPKGREHEVSWHTGVEEYGWFYRQNPRETRVKGEYPTEAKTVRIDAGYVARASGGFARWKVVETKTGVDDDSQWKNVQAKPDPEVPDRRFDYVVDDWTRRKIHDDAPEDN